MSDDAALADRALALASNIRRLLPMWTDPEKFFIERSELSAEAEAIARGIAPDAKLSSRVKVDVKRGGARGAGTLVINGRTVTVQRRRNAFAISAR